MEKKSQDTFILQHFRKIEHMEVQIQNVENQDSRQLNWNRRTWPTMTEDGSILCNSIPCNKFEKFIKTASENK